MILHYFLIICFLLFFSGLSRTTKHFGAKMQRNSPKADARMAKTCTATMYLPCVLTYTGINVIHTAKKISMLNVINLASLKLSGSFLAKKASKKHMHASRPMYPNTHQNPVSDPTLHSTIIVGLRNSVVYTAEGGLVVSHMIQIST